MTTPANQNPASNGGPAGTPQQTQGRVVGQFIRDLSFENPNIDKLLANPNEKPNIRLDVNVNAKAVRPGLYESGISFKAEATAAFGTIYILEIEYAGLFQLENVPQNALEPMLLVNCPMLLFPFLRRLVADITREGGFPPLLLDPFDFAQLYMNRQRQAQAGAATGSVKPS